MALSDTTSNRHQTIYLTYKDGTKATFTGHDLAARWEVLSVDPGAEYGDFYVPGVNKPRLHAYFGNIVTVLPI